MQLFIGNKNYSSWSLRPWLVLTHFGIAFEEVRLSLDFADGSAFKQRIGQLTPTGKVPVLVDEGFAVWDTLAIVEYLADRFPQLPLWPVERQQRARARTLCAEMHSGFGALRSHCPMNIEASLPEVGQRVLATQPEVQRDLDRLVAMWAEQLGAQGGPFLFGDFTIADAFFAPVCTRLRTYGLPVDAVAQGYVERIHALPAMQAWVSAALAEHDFLAFNEPYRSAPSWAPA